MVLKETYGEQVIFCKGNHEVMFLNYIDQPEDNHELENPEDELKYNGVVYSEMKGAFSDPDDILERQILNNLFPDTVYAVESGGDPDIIPELTYEDFLAFHSKFYHPSNSYIFLYGNADMAEKLDYIDREYLSKYEKVAVDSDIELQKAFDKKKEFKYEYPITEDEDENWTVCY